MKKLPYVVRGVLCVPGGILAYFVVMVGLSVLLGLTGIRFGVVAAVAGFVAAGASVLVAASIAPESRALVGLCMTSLLLMTVVGSAFKGLFIATQSDDLPALVLCAATLAGCVSVDWLLCRPGPRSGAETTAEETEL